MRRLLLTTIIVFVIACMATLTSAEKVVIKGSNTFGESLGPELIKVYQMQHPDVEIPLERRGSGSGIAALISEACDIASTSRAVNEDELRKAKSRRVKLKLHTIGYYGVAVIVNNNNPFTSFTDAQIRDIFTGRITNWQDLGWEDREISLYIRDAVSGTRLGFRELAMGDEPYSSTANDRVDYREIANDVARDPGGVGYVGMHVSEQSGVHILSINGIPPSDYAVNQGMYPYARLLRFYTDRNRESEATVEFIRFVQSPEGQAVLDEMGYIPRRKHSFGALPGPSF